MESLSSAEVDDIAAYFNFDMLGSPNPGYFVYDDDSNGTEMRDSLIDLYTAAGIDSDYIDVDGRSDHAAFMQRGIPTVGTFSGAEGRKTSAQASKWGGQSGRAFDPCYHASCDDISNIDTSVLDINTDMIAETLWDWADHDFGGGTTEPPVGDDVIVNGDFEDGNSGWQTTSNVINSDSGQPDRGGAAKAWFVGYGSPHTDTASQTVTVPEAGVLRFWLKITTNENTNTYAYDTFRAQVVTGSGTTTLQTWSNLDDGGYREINLDLSSYAGQSVAVKFIGVEDTYQATSFVVDDVSLTPASAAWCK